MFRATSTMLNQQVFQNRLRRFLNTSVARMVYQDEPDYLKYLKPQVPIYEQINIQIKSYDFTVLEHYSKDVHRALLNMGLDVENAWASPHQAFEVTNKEPNSDKVAHNYHLNVYERNLQVTTLPAYSAHNCFQIIQSILPAGISVSVHHHEQQYEEYRYIPDFELISLKRNLLETEAEVDPNKATELVEVVKAEKAAAKTGSKSKTKNLI